MDEKQTFGRRRKHSVFLIGILALLAVLCLALLTSAQASPIGISTTASPDAVYPGSTVQYSTTFTNSTETDIEILVMTHTLATGFTFVGMAEESAVLQDPLALTGTLVWKDSSYTLPVSQTLILAYDLQVDVPSSPRPYENLVEARLLTGEVVFSTALVRVVEQDQDSDPEPVTATPTLTVTEPVTEPTPEPVIEPTPEPVTEPTPVPVIEPTTEPVTVTVPVDVPTAEAPAGIAAGPYWLYMPLVMRTEAQYRIAYESNPSNSNWEVYAVDASGANRVNVSNLSGGDAEPVWSPGRTKIAWVHYLSGSNGEIYVANADGSNKQNLTNNSALDWTPAWSPDGSEIAFTSMRDGVREIYKMNADGSGVQKLTDQLCQSYSPTWSPDGQKIAFICGVRVDPFGPLHEIYIMSANGSNERRLTVDDHPGCEDPEGEPVDCPHYEDTALTWAPDSTWLAYTKYYNKRHTKGDIYKLNTSLGSPEQINLTDTFDMAEHSPDWARTGGKIAFSAYLDGTYEIATMNTDGSNVTNLTHAAQADYKPRWSSDATMIAFLSNRAGGSLELYSMNADGSGQTRLTTTDLDEDNPFWRP